MKYKYRVLQFEEEIVRHHYMCKAVFLWMYMMSAAYDRKWTMSADTDKDSVFCP